MNDIMVQLIIGCLTAGGTIIGVIASNDKHDAVVDVKLDNLTDEVKKHNNFAQRIPVLEELHEDRAVYIIGFSHTRVTGDAETRRNIDALCTLDYYGIYAVTRKPSHYEFCILYEDTNLRRSLLPRFLEREGLSSEKAASVTE